MPLRPAPVQTRNVTVPPPNSEYEATVLRITYTYASCKFAHHERLQLHEITDDVLKREIIKESRSPYCTRIVPVRKKSGKLRLCIDLRPLNERVIKQKFPFLLIEDCLLRLGNKSVFTLLDLKHGFHQIKVHPDHTHFFAFATPDGQFEYTKLPFGYSELPAEFQKRLVQILQSLNRENKVIIYIDDILIATETVETNLQTLKEVLLKLKQYDFEQYREISIPPKKNRISEVHHLARRHHNQ